MSPGFVPVELQVSLYIGKLQRFSINTTLEVFLKSLPLDHLTISFLFTS